MRLQFGKDSNTGGYSGLAVGKSGRDGIQPGAYRGGPRDHLRIVVIRLRRAAEFAKRADRSTLHVVGLGFRKGCWGSEVLAGWPDGVQYPLGWRQWPDDPCMSAPPVARCQSMPTLYTWAISSLLCWRLTSPTGPSDEFQGQPAGW